MDERGDNQAKQADVEQVDARARSTGGDGREGWEGGGMEWRRHGMEEAWDGRGTKRSRRCHVEDKVQGKLARSSRKLRGG